MRYSPKSDLIKTEWRRVRTGEPGMLERLAGRDSVIRIVDEELDYEVLHLGGGVRD